MSLKYRSIDRNGCIGRGTTIGWASGGGSIGGGGNGVGDVRGGFIVAVFASGGGAGILAIVVVVGN